MKPRAKPSPTVAYPHRASYEQAVVVEVEATDEATLAVALALAKHRIPSINELTISSTGQARVRTRRA